MSTNSKPERLAWLAITLTMISMTALPIAVLAEPSALSPVDASWPMWRHDPAHTGAADGIGPKTLGIKWKVDLGAPLDSSPTVVDGRIYIGSRDHNLYCLDAQNGSITWKYTTGWKIRSTPAVVNGKVYTGADDGNIYCLDADNGQPVWTKPTEGGLIMTVLQPIAQIRSSPTVVDDRVYVGHLDKHLYCLDAATGDTIWKFEAWDRIVSSPAVVDGKVYVGSCDGLVYCLRTTDGKRLWGFDTTRDDASPSPTLTEVDSSPCVVNNTVYVFGNAGSWHALDAETGAVKWKYAINSYRGSSEDTSSIPYGSVTYACGKVYFVDVAYAACADADSGKVLWEKPLGYVSYSSLGYTDGKVYIGSDGYVVHVFDAETGEKLSSYEVGSNIRSSCSIAYGNLYVGAGDWNLYCFTEAPIKPPKTKTEIIGTLSASKVTVNTSITIRGTITPTPKTAHVTVTLKMPDEKTKDVPAEVREDGTYEVTYRPSMVGTWTAKASWSGDDLNEGASSTEVTFTVASTSPPPPSTAANIPNEYAFVAIVSILTITLVGIINARKGKSAKRNF